MHLVCIICILKITLIVVKVVIEKETKLLLNCKQRCDEALVVLWGIVSCNEFVCNINQISLSVRSHLI